MKVTARLANLRHARVDRGAGSAGSRSTNQTGKARQQRQNYFFTSYPRRLQQHARPRLSFLCRLTHPLPTRKDGRRFPSNGDSQELQSAFYGLLVCIPGLF